MNSHQIKLQPNQANSILNNIKSKYLVKLIFDNLKIHKTLKIIKYNKIIQNRIEKTKNDYKDYSKIIIELIPYPNIFGKFINVPSKEEQYFYIYFDKGKERIKNNYLTSRDKVSKIKIIITNEVTSFSGLFEDCESIQIIHFTHFFRNNITNMSRLFSWCTSLKEINLNNFNTDNVTDMSCMFAGCSSLSKIIFSDFDTSNVTDMSYMFSGCNSLRELNLSNFRTNNVTNMTSMFNFCDNLIDLNISNFNMNNVIFMNDMFNGCSIRLINKIRIENININDEAFIN